MGDVDFSEMRTEARSRLSDLVWAYYEATAGGTRGERRRDARTWRTFDLVPRSMRGSRETDTSTTLPSSMHRGGATLRTPIMVAPTAGHGMADPAGEIATGRAAAACGALMVYSNSATVEVGQFGAAMTGPWWVQHYFKHDRTDSFAYLDRAAEAGAGAVVLTVDLGHSAADPTFRRTVQAQLPAILGNYPGATWSEAGAGYEADLTPDVITEIVDHTGLPVHVKGILRADDALEAIEAGAAGIIVSNHGRRQLTGVVPAAEVLAPIVEAVEGRVPVMVDGGIRSGVDALRGLALGADLVGVGRPVLWGLAARGEAGVTEVLATLTDELAQAMASAGATSPAQVGADLLHRR